MNKASTAIKKNSENDNKKKCFVIMPISDQDGYESGHFNRVYNHLIKPAILKAGFEAHRADEQSSSNLIILDIIKKIVDSDLVLCDLSAKNPNVLYELGIRQAFDKKTVLIKDNKTEKIFDISSLRTIPYDDKLRIDNTQKEIELIAKSIGETFTSKETDGNSLIQLLSIASAKLDNNLEISQDSQIVFNALKSFESKLSNFEGFVRKNSRDVRSSIKHGHITLELHHDLFIENDYVGEIIDIGSQNNVITKLGNGQVKVINLNLYSPQQIRSEEALPF